MLCEHVNKYTCTSMFACICMYAYVYTYVLHAIDIIIAIEMCHIVVFRIEMTKASTTTIKSLLIDIQFVYKSLKMHLHLFFPSFS